MTTQVGTIAYRDAEGNFSKTWEILRDLDDSAEEEICKELGKLFALELQKQVNE